MPGLNTVRMEFMTSPEVARYLQHSDLAILPVGCIEMHGPHVPLGCDTMHAHAMAVILAEQWECLVLPPVTYTYPGASTPWPGTISPRPSVSQKWLKEICMAAIRNGFERLIVVGTHGPLKFLLSNVIREIHHESGSIVLHLAPGKLMPDDRMEEAFGYGRGEDILVLASARVLGLPEGLVRQGFADSPGRCFPFESLSKLRQTGCNQPWTFSEPWQHQPVRSQVQPEHADKAVELMRRVARERYADVPRLFETYRSEMQAMEEHPPWDIDAVAAMKPDGEQPQSASQTDPDRT